MKDQLERELERTLMGAADSAPQPGPGLLDSVRARRRGRRQRRALVVAAACAVAVVVAGLTVALRPDPSPAPVGRPVWSGDVPDIEGAGPIDKLWPDAVRRLPPKLPDGSAYSVHALLGDDRYLVLPRYPEVGTQLRLSVYDVPAGTVTPLAGVAPLATVGSGPPNPTGGQESVDRTVLGTAAGRVAWAVLMTDSTGAATVDVWSDRLDGGEPARRLARITLPTLPSPAWSSSMCFPSIPCAAVRAVVREDAVYLIVTSGGTPNTFAYRVPTDGGAASGVPGLGRDWAPLRGDTAWVYFPEDNVSGLPATGELRNVVTGERIGWRAHPDVAQLHFCDPVMCLGQTADGRWIAQRPDGTGFPWPAPRPDSNGNADSWTMNSTLDGRFGVLHTFAGTALWDRTGGGYAQVLPRAGGELLFGVDGEVYAHELDVDAVQGEKVVIDLRAVG